MVIVSSGIKISAYKFVQHSIFFINADAREIFN